MPCVFHGGFGDISKMIQNERKGICTFLLMSEEDEKNMPTFSEKRGHVLGKTSACFFIFCTKTKENVGVFLKELEKAFRTGCRAISA